MGNYREYVEREPRTPESIVNKMNFIRRYPGNHLLSFLIVEGETDRKLYTAFVSNDGCRITIAYSKTTAIKVLTMLEKDNFPGILAIVDADFDVLEGKVLITSNLMLTDSHDAETMMIQSPALNKLLSELGSEEKIVDFVKKTGKNVRTVLIEGGMYIGYLRWVSLLDGLSLKFEDLDFKKFVEEKMLTIDISKLIKTVKDKSQKPSIVEKDIQNRIEQLKDGNHDPWHICCGHDLVCILSIGLCKAIGSCNTNEVKPDVLERSLRLAFERSHFQKTQLYLSIRNWEEANKPFVILSVE